MSGYEEELLLTVLAGVGDPPLMRMPVDTVVGPLSIGSSASWPIVAPGVMGEHGYIYFDGAELFLQSADPENPLLVDGQPVPNEWTTVYWPCEISLGVARLHYDKPGQTVRLPEASAGLGTMGPLQGPALPIGLGSLPRTTPPPFSPSPSLDVPPLPASPTFEFPKTTDPPPWRKPAAAKEPEAAKELEAPKQPIFAGAASGPQGPEAALELPPKREQPSKPARPFAPGAFSSREPDPDATRLHPIEITAAGRGVKLKRPDGDEASRPSPESGGSAPSLNVAPPVVPRRPPPVLVVPGTPAAGPLPSAPTPSAPTPGAVPPSGTPPRAAPPATPAAAPPRGLGARWKKASGLTKTLVVLPLPLLGLGWLIVTQLRLFKTPPSAPRMSPSAVISAQPAASQATDAPTARPADSSRSVAPRPPTSTPATSSSGRTAQREAADAVSKGAFEQAAKLYEELAKAHPDVPAYAEAARILRAKVKR